MAAGRMIQLDGTQIGNPWFRFSYTFLLSA